MSFARKPEVLKKTNKLACSKTRFNEDFCPEAWKIRSRLTLSLNIARRRRHKF
jgi:hypothetical protein